MYIWSTVRLRSPIVHLYAGLRWSAFVLHGSPCTFGLQWLQLCSFGLLTSVLSVLLGCNSVHYGLFIMFNVCPRVRYGDLSSGKLNKETIIKVWYQLEMAWTENLCPLSALHQQLLSAVRTASAFGVHYSVRVRAAPQSQSFTP